MVSAVKSDSFQKKRIPTVLQKAEGPRRKQAGKKADLVSEITAKKETSGKGTEKEQLGAYGDYQSRWVQGECTSLLRFSSQEEANITHGSLLLGLHIVRTESLKAVVLNKTKALDSCLFRNQGFKYFI